MAKGRNGNNYNGSNKRSKSGRNGRQNMRKNGSSCDQDTKSSIRGNPSKPTNALNDMSWYNRYPDLLAATAKIPFPYRPGYGAKFGPFEVAETSSTSKTYDNIVNIPGVMAIRFMPTIGYSNRVMDPASIAGREIYARVRNAFSGTLEADAPDYIMYLMALDSIFMGLGALKRFLRIAHTYSPSNYAVPGALLSSMGANLSAQWADVQNNYTLYWGRLNELIYKTLKYKCPAVMDIFNRHYWMCDNVYTDAPTPNSQFYIFVPEYLYKYSYNEAGYGELKPVAFMTFPTVGTSVFQVWLDVLDGMIEAFSEEDTNYTINGYLQRAFEGAPSFAVALYDPMEQLTPVYVPEVLAQIENSASLPIDPAFTNMIITQNVTNNAVVTEGMTLTLPYTTTDITAKIYENKDFLTSRSENPSVEELVEITRLHTTCTPISVEDHTFRIVCGTEIVIGYRIHVYNAVANTAHYYAYRTNQIIDLTEESTLATRARTALTSQLWKSQFDWAPLTRVWSVVMVNTSYQWNDVINGDMHNFTSVSPIDIENISRVCIFSELNAFSI